MERVNHFIEVRLMNFDTIILQFAIFSVTVIALIGTFYGIKTENVILYLGIGLMLSVYKLFKSKQSSRRSTIATIILGFFFSMVVAPTIEIKTEYQPLVVGTMLGGLVLLGELGIELTFKRILGLEIELSKPPDRKVKKIQHKKLIENEE